MEDNLLLVFNWSAYWFKVLVSTGVIFAVFAFYDYFILDSKVKQDIYDNPTKRDKGVDNRPQISNTAVSNIQTDEMLGGISNKQ